MAETCLPQFPLQKGWLGGDGAYSVPLSKTKSLFVFGDSFVGPEGLTSRSGTTMVDNSVGILDCKPGAKTTMSYHWQKLPGGKHGAFFPSQEPQVRYWPKDGFMHNKKLYLFFDRIKILDAATPFSFQHDGSTLFIVNNPMMPPSQWMVQRRTVIKGQPLSVAASAVIQGKFAYLFSTVHPPAKKNHPVIYLRVLLSSLNRSKLKFDTLTKGKWQPGLLWKSAQVLFEPGSSEMSVRYSGHAKTWRAVLNSPDFPSSAIHLRTATSPTDPWTSPKIIFSFKDEPTTKDKDTFCYAAKEHSQHGAKNNLLLTYVCNSMRFKKVTANTDLYFPKLLNLPL